MRVFLFGFLMGCTNWPLHQQQDLWLETGVPVGTDPRLGVEVNWTDLGEETEPNDEVGSPMPIAVGEGWIITGTLQGSGWDPSAGPTISSNEDCGDPLWFPPTEGGNYTGDVDWLTSLPSTEGTLCAFVQVRNPNGTPINFDFLVYALNSCAEPSIPFTDPESDEPIGFSTYGSVAEWQVPATGNRAIALALAAYHVLEPVPAELPWSIAIALSPTGVCPYPPEFQ